MAYPAFTFDDLLTRDPEFIATIIDIHEEAQDNG